MDILAQSDIIDYIFYLPLHDVISLTRVNTNHYKSINTQLSKFLTLIQRSQLTLHINTYFIEYTRNEHYHDNDDRGRKLIRKVDIPYFLQSNEKILYCNAFNDNSEVKMNVITLLQTMNPYDLFINENYRNIIDCTDGHDITILITCYNKYLSFNVFYSETRSSSLNIHHEYITNKHVLLATITGNLSLLNLLHQNKLTSMLSSIGNLYCRCISLR